MTNIIYGTQATLSVYLQCAVYNCFDLFVCTLISAMHVNQTRLALLLSAYLICCRLFLTSLLLFISLIGVSVSFLFHLQFVSSACRKIKLSTIIWGNMRSMEILFCISNLWLLTTKRDKEKFHMNRKSSSWPKLFILAHWKTHHIAALGYIIWKIYNAVSFSNPLHARTGSLTHTHWKRRSYLIRCKMNELNLLIVWYLI